MTSESESLRLSLFASEPLAHTVTSDHEIPAPEFCIITWLRGSSDFSVMPDCGRGVTTREVRDGYQIFLSYIQLARLMSTR